MGSSVINPNLNFEMRKVERFAKQKVRSKNVEQTILSQTSLRSSSNSVENSMSAVVIMSKRTSNDATIFPTTF